MLNKITIPVILLLAAVFSPLPSQESELRQVEREVEALRQAYPDVQIYFSYDRTLEDYEIVLRRDGDRSVLYRAGGRYLTSELLPRKENFWQLLYRFSETLRDPADFTQEQLDRVMQFGSTENRRSGRVGATALFDALYDTETREDVENHIVRWDFLGQALRVHYRITAPLERVEQKIRDLAASDPVVQDFIDELGSASGYSWRSVRDTSGKSFHSMGLAIDILPRDLDGKAIYWNWEKNKGNDLWMLIPLADRWMPPESVIRIFESEGFTWGGMWPIWDNMHFEYRPELLVWRDFF